MSTVTTTIDRAAPPESGPRALIQRLKHGDEVHDRRIAFPREVRDAEAVRAAFIEMIRA